MTKPVSANPTLEISALIAEAIHQMAGRIEEHGPFPTLSQTEITSFLQEQYTFESPLALQNTIEITERLLDAGVVHPTHPRYLGLFEPNVSQAAIMGDVLTALYNPQLSVQSHAPAAHAIEQHTLGWLASNFGWKAGEFSAHFTSGGMEANLTAVLTALSHHFPDWRDNGIRGCLKQPVFYVSASAHHSFDKAAAIAGLGHNSIRRIPVNARFEMDVQALASQIVSDRAQGHEPFLVVGTLGTTGTGAIDPIEYLSALCKKETLWLHIDAAWGGAATFSPKIKPTILGLDKADSITWDAHKWLPIPMGAGMFFCAHQNMLEKTFQVSTPYIALSQDEFPNPFSTSVQWSRRFIGLKVFMFLATFGKSGIQDLVTHQIEMGEYFKARLIETGWEIVNTTPLPLVCFTKPGLNIPLFLSEFSKLQIGWFSRLLLPDGRDSIRACITNFNTHSHDIDNLVAALNKK